MAENYFSTFHVGGYESRFLDRYDKTKPSKGFDSNNSTYEKCNAHHASSILYSFTPVGYGIGIKKEPYDAEIYFGQAEIIEWMMFEKMPEGLSRESAQKWVCENFQNSYEEYPHSNGRIYNPDNGVFE